MKKISIIVPALNEASVIGKTLEELEALRRRGHQVVLADGGSVDGTAGLARPRVDRVVVSAPGRATQMNAGASCSDGDILWFLHADTQIPGNADELINAALDSSCKRGWGRFDVSLSAGGWRLETVARLMNLRSRVSGVATGDQGIFISRTLFGEIGGFADIPLMEDVEISKRLRSHSWPVCVKKPLCTSSRRWEEQGVARTVLLMWCLRLAFFLGVPARRLARLYA